MGQPAPCVRAFGDAVDAAMRTHQPQPALSGTQRTGRAFCLTAVLVTNAMCWARCARASLGTEAMAALAWRLRHRQMPWAHLLVASVRGILRHPGITAGTLVVDDTDHPRSQSAQALASLSQLREQARGGSLWGPSLVCLVLVPPTISLPVGVVFSPPAPELSVWDTTAKRLKQQGGPPPQRPRQPAPHPPSPPKAHLALR